MSDTVQTACNPVQRELPANRAGSRCSNYNDNGWLDLFIANDTEPNRLYKNNGNGTFTDEAATAGVAFSDAGTARAGMGVDAGDYEGSGRQGIAVGNFTNESMALYSNDGTGIFTNEASQSGIGKMSAQSLTFAVFFFDYDLDGMLDIFAANGHVSDDISVVQSFASKVGNHCWIGVSTGSGSDLVSDRHAIFAKDFGL